MRLMAYVHTALGQDHGLKGQSGKQGKTTNTGDPNKESFDATRMVQVRCSRGAGCTHKLGAVQAKWRFTNAGIERTSGFV